ncbi:uncharacterized protein [Solanum tuberosum]|uniref:uncharacterized protein n=1 Tax=Solanum tuberosum TaxID=4113 RepID=UPI000739F8EC|nr:PREDICTED: uncharacterized protein LOC107061469 [Solanum tuberosum]
MHNDLTGIGQKVNAHVVSIKQLEQQFCQLSATWNLRQPAPFYSNTIQNPKNDGHCMEVTTRRGKQTIDPPMSSEVEKVIRNNEDENERPGYAKFMKDLVTKKRAVSFENEEKLQHCSVISTMSLVQKKEDPGAFTIPCTIGILHFAKALCDLGGHIDLMPLSIYKKLRLGAPKPTAMRLLMAYRTVKRPIGVLQDVLVKVESLILSADFAILDFEVPIILGRLFLATGRALVDMERGQMKFRLNNEEVTFNICRSMKHEYDLKSVSVVNHIEEQ